MKMTIALTFGALLAAAPAAFAYDYDYDTPAVPVAAETAVLTAENGMTLYTFDKDSDATSTCYGDCAANWPPYLVEAGATAPSGFSVVTRQDGSAQWAKDGAPLYFWIGDSEPGDTNGDGVGGVWHVAK